MSPSDIQNLRAIEELEKALRAELHWFGSVGEISDLVSLRSHCIKVKGLLNDLAVEKMIAAQKRVPDNKQSRSWHR